MRASPESRRLTPDICSSMRTHVSQDEDTRVAEVSLNAYVLDAGVAREQARALLTHVLQ